jgi:hypothetical protein
MPHFLVDQLRFSRAELQRCLAGISDTDARQRLDPMNCISWSLGHLANQEQTYWLVRAQNKTLYPVLNSQVGYGSPPSQPPLADMWDAWHHITTESDSYLDALTPEIMTQHLLIDGEKSWENIGNMLLRVIHHYWFHIGEAHAIRQMLGHKNLPDFVGDVSNFGYSPES